MKIDINCDVGEGIKNEHLIMPYISSCNVACGGHFGNETTIDNTIKLAIKNKVKIGAHPSLPDKENFGRKLIEISNIDLKTSIQNQLDLLLERLDVFGVRMHHIKPHGALYNAIAKDEELAILFFDIVKSYLKDVFLYVPYHSQIEKVALKNNVNIKYEAFADRNYNSDLSLVSRKENNGVLTDKKAIFEHVLFMIKHKKVKTLSGLKKEIRANTFCVHSDTQNALEIVKYLHQNLTKEGHTIG